MTPPSITVELTSTENTNKALWRAVLYQAILDATEPLEQPRPPSIQQNNIEAKLWFNATLCTLAEDFKEICDLAGLDPANVKIRVKQILSNRIPFQRRRLNIILSETSA